MKLPSNSIIAPEKVVRYLLIPQAKGDKSAFLAQAGYDLANASLLMDDLRNHVLPREATWLESTIYGEFYEIFSSLTGPNGTTLPIRTIWMKEHLSGITKFITLIPVKKLQP